MPILRDGPKNRATVNAPLLAAIVFRWHATQAFVEYVGARPKEAAVGAFARPLQRRHQRRPGRLWRPSAFAMRGGAYCPRRPHAWQCRAELLRVAAWFHDDDGRAAMHALFSGALTKDPVAARA
jgi:hypothetical protein